jgi:2-C-methyl-D-erythritol 4-phosphate cytidylyltransferase/2-C-methyl-D-erythritol 2,4-cyclodiphosphate synthase
VILPAGGKGVRVGGAEPKQFLALGGKTMLLHALETFHRMDCVKSIVLVLPPDRIAAFSELPASFPKAVLVEGGTERWESVRNGFRALDPSLPYVLVHDVARPFVTEEVIGRCLAAATPDACVIAALPASDTVKETDGPKIVGTLDRRRLILVQTPQVFPRTVLEAIYAAPLGGDLPTDEAQMAERIGREVRWVSGSESGRKVTGAADLAWAEWMAARPAVASEKRTTMFKVGIGQDSHRIQEPAAGKDGAPAKALVLGGVTLREAYALEGNSDSDVVLHAVTNGISGITGKPILGPVADKLCKSGITDSSAYLKKALEDLDAAGYRITHVSVSLECRRPKILPILPAMKSRVSEILGIAPEDVGITATTGEELTDFGKGLGIQAFACVTASRILLP